MSRSNYGRHLPAFILLFLARESIHGSKLLNRINESMPNLKADGPAIYRALNDLETSGAVKAAWDTVNSGAAKKCYTLTKKGYAMLKEFNNDIKERKKNLEYFLAEFGKLDFKD